MTNRLVESLSVFENIVQNELVSDIFLVFTCVDMFERFIYEYPLTNLFPEYKNGNDPKNCIEYIQNKFIEKYIGKNYAINMFTINTLDSSEVYSLLKKCLRYSFPTLNLGQIQKPEHHIKYKTNIKIFTQMKLLYTQTKSFDTNFIFK